MRPGWRSQDVTGTLAARGRRPVSQLGCSGCHTAGSTVRAPPLEGLYGRPVPLQGGDVVIADDKYIRDSILLPRTQVAAGYEPVMPSYRRQGRARTISCGWSPTSSRSADTESHAP